MFEAEAGSAGGASPGDVTSQGATAYAQLSADVIAAAQALRSTPGGAAALSSTLGVTMLSLPSVTVEELPSNPNPIPNPNPNANPNPNPNPKPNPNPNPNQVEYLLTEITVFAPLPPAAPPPASPPPPPPPPPQQPPPISPLSTAIKFVFTEVGLMGP